MKKRIAIYPGTFDRVTNGHLDIIERTARIFERLVVAIVRNPDKAPFFTEGERIEMLRRSVARYSNVVVDSFEGLLVQYAVQTKAEAIIRGLRAVSDFDFEFQMALFNRRMKSNVETLFMMTDYKYTYLSSSLVKQISLLGGNIQGLVPPIVEKYLQKKREK